MPTATTERPRSSPIVLPALSLWVATCVTSETATLDGTPWRTPARLSPAAIRGSSRTKREPSARVRRTTRGCLVEISCSGLTSFSTCQLVHEEGLCLRTERMQICPVLKPYAPVAQLDRASASGAEGRGFESRLAHRVRESLTDLSQWLSQAPFILEAPAPTRERCVGRRHQPPCAIRCRARTPESRLTQPRRQLRALTLHGNSPATQHAGRVAEDCALLCGRGCGAIT